MLLTILEFVGLAIVYGAIFNIASAIAFECTAETARISTLAIYFLFAVGGYYIFEGVLYGFLPSVANVPANAMQGLAGLLLGLILVKIFEKTKMLFYFLLV